MKSKLLILSCFFLIFPNTIFAETTLVTGIYTKHFNSNDNLNEYNQLIGFKTDNFGYFTFVNSQYNRSHFITGRFQSDIRKNNFFLKGNLYAGILFGYEDDMPNIKGYTIGIIPSLEIGYKMISIETTILHELMVDWLELLLI